MLSFYLQKYKNFRFELEFCLMKAIDNVLRSLVDYQKIVIQNLRYCKKQGIKLNVFQFKRKLYNQPSNSKSINENYLNQNYNFLFKKKNILGILNKFVQLQINRLISNNNNNKEMIQQQRQLEIIQEENEQNLTPKQQLKSHFSACSDSEFQTLQEDCSKTITQIIQNSLAQSLSQADIKQILEPEQQISLQHRQSVDINQQIVQYTEETTKKFQLFFQFYEESIDNWECVTTKDDIYIKQ
ncbi:unnamed protein product [Paramecium sonneborni]|uniref:Uncharacterized protein n=1 Tax=Paramecium sonneborni TaxID=65129 RepID=A0A8S1NDU9_9CILI|nr:unnamed protein product [Paramecium sonneborni]CAD8087717.1 unnamed protein product [Paramecium sonneborni]